MLCKKCSDSVKSKERLKPVSKSSGTLCKDCRTKENGKLSHREPSKSHPPSINVTGKPPQAMATTVTRLREIFSQDEDTFLAAVERSLK